MPDMHYLEVRRDLESRGYIITGAVEAHPMADVCVEFTKNTWPHDTAGDWEWRAIVYELVPHDGDQYLKRRLCFAHIKREG